nr:MAG TPA: hypothetical protein [Caudoviricetes sp.]
MKNVSRLSPTPSKAFIRKSGVFRFINNPVKTILNQGWY